MNTYCRITVAPTGARRTKSDYPNLPTSIDEIVHEAARCFDAGAARIHLHVRDRQGRHTLDAGIYREATRGIQELRPQMQVQITTESASRYDVAAQVACLKAALPRSVSISVREMQRDELLAAAAYAFCAEAEIEVQHILYNLKDLQLLRQWQRAGTVRGSMNSVLFVLGQYAPAREAQPGDLLPFLNEAEGLDWSVCAFGAREFACTSLAMLLGGDIRVGFENNVLLPNGARAADNAELIALSARQAGEFGIALAHPTLKSDKTNMQTGRNR